MLTLSCDKVCTGSYANTERCLFFNVRLENSYYSSFMLGSSCSDRSPLQFEILVLIYGLYSRQVVLELFSPKGSAEALHWSCEGTGKYNLGKSLLFAE
jgi:hypothetical protein